MQLQSEVSPVVPRRGGRNEPNLSGLVENSGTYLALRALISMYKCVCQELDNSRCSFPCKSHAGGLSQSVRHKQLGDKIPKIVLGVFADKTTGVLYDQPASIWRVCLALFNSSCGHIAFTRYTGKIKHEKRNSPFVKRDTFSHWGFRLSASENRLSITAARELQWGFIQVRCSSPPHINSSYGAAPRAFWQPFKFNIHARPFYLSCADLNCQPSPASM